MRPYRIKHKPTGLYYQPIANGNNLSERGKIYLTNNNPLINRGADYIGVGMRTSSKTYRKYKEKLLELDDECCSGKIWGRIEKGKFEIEYIKLEED